MLAAVNQDQSSSHLFLVRMWREDLGCGNSEWRGKVQHVLSGEARFFREWAMLVEHLRAMLLERCDETTKGGAANSQLPNPNSQIS